MGRIHKKDFSFKKTHPSPQGVKMLENPSTWFMDAVHAYEMKLSPQNVDISKAMFTRRAGGSRHVPHVDIW